MLNTLFGQYSKDIKAATTAMFLMHFIVIILYRSKLKWKNLLLWSIPIGIFLIIVATFIFDKFQLG